MTTTAATVLALVLLLSAGLTVTFEPGASNLTPPGYHVANFDPNLNSSANNEIYDANFIPGFQAGLTQTSISWVSGEGFGRIGYWIGPWSHDEDGLPHLAVGPQCCNFVEVAHTQQFREPSWGDYYYVKAGFGPPGVNLENYTSDFKAPADVGLRTDWNWTVQFSLDWAVPSLLNQSNEWAAIGIAATQYVPGVQGNLVYTVVNLWMDRNSSSGLSPSAVGTERMVEPDVVVYHPVQISSGGNVTVSLNLSKYLVDTLAALGLSSSSPAPVISYVYLNVEGYNFRWNTTLWSFRVMTQNAPVSPSPVPFVLGAAAVAATVVVVVIAYRLRYARGASFAAGPVPK